MDIFIIVFIIYFSWIYSLQIIDTSILMQNF